MEEGRLKLATFCTTTGIQNGLGVGWGGRNKKASQRRIFALSLRQIFQHYTFYAIQKSQDLESYGFATCGRYQSLLNLEQSPKFL